MPTATATKAKTAAQQLIDAQQQRERTESKIQSQRRLLAESELELKQRICADVDGTEPFSASQQRALQQKITDLKSDGDASTIRLDAINERIAQLEQSAANDRIEDALADCCSSAALARKHVAKLVANYNATMAELQNICALQHDYDYHLGNAMRDYGAIHGRVERSEVKRAGHPIQRAYQIDDFINIDGIKKGVQSLKPMDAEDF